MRASNFKIWGVKAESILEDGFTYRLIQAIIYAADIVVVGGTMAVMAGTGTYFGKYFEVTLVVTVLTYFVTMWLIHRPKYATFMHLEHIAHNKVYCDVYYATPQELYEILYQERKVRLKKDDTVANYIACFNNACMRDNMLSVRFMRALEGLENTKTAGSVKVYAYSVLMGSKRHPVKSLLHMSDMNEAEVIMNDTQRAMEAFESEYVDHTLSVHATASFDDADEDTDESVGTVVTEDMQAGVDYPIKGSDADVDSLEPDDANADGQDDDVADDDSDVDDSDADIDSDSENVEDVSDDAVTDADASDSETE